MRPVIGVQKHVSVFISHCAEDNNEAKDWERRLTEAGVTVQQYGHSLLPGAKLKAVASQIDRCNFFLFLVSNVSTKSDWVQRELGLALEVQKKNQGYRPLIIPIYSQAMSAMPTFFPTKNFYSEEAGDMFSLQEVRGLDIYQNPAVDLDALIRAMTPNLLVSRLNFDDEDTFFETDVFSLYERLFSPVERDSPDDIIHWVLHSDIGEARRKRLRDGTEITYDLDSRFFILVLAERAIGLAFYTYDRISKLMCGNYIGVHECWRSGDVAGAFSRNIEAVLKEVFPGYRGTVFEVERLGIEDVERIIFHLERTGRKTFESEEDRNKVRRFLRISIYQKAGCMFFCNKSSGRPLVCRSPCLDPHLPVEDWAGQEEDYWLMWYDRQEVP